MNYANIAACIGGAKGGGSKINLSPLRFTNVGEEAATIAFNDLLYAQPNFKIRLQEGADWTNWDYSAVTLQPGEFMELCGNNEKSITGYDEGSEESGYFIMTGSISASGNIMSLCYEDLTDVNTLIIPNFEYFFAYMFNGCTGLTSAPELPATTLEVYCYKGMFNSCTGLTSAPELPATTLAVSCYESMFNGCTGLTSAPELPATTLADSCYESMFNGCTGLTSAPELPATTLADSCYAFMFGGCTSLTSAPKLPATTLADSCYRGMFSGCTGLTSAPELSATTLAVSCYYNMFNGCTSLTSITCLATNNQAADCTHFWLKSVAASGTFTKAASMTGWTTGTSGIPTGWTVVDAQ